MSSIRSITSASNPPETFARNSLTKYDICSNETCAMQTYAKCSHCDVHYCFGHFLSHREQLSIDAQPFLAAINQLEEQVKNIRLDGVLHRAIDALDKWRSNLIQNIEHVYQQKLNIIKAKHYQLHRHLQQFQFEQFSQIQALRGDLERNKAIRNNYDREINGIDFAIKQLHQNFMDLRCDLVVKEHSIYDIEKSVDCEMIWSSSPNGFHPVHNRSEPNIPMNKFYHATYQPSTGGSLIDMTPPHSATKSPKIDDERLRFFTIDSDDEDTSPSLSSSSKSNEQSNKISSMIGASASSKSLDKSPTAELSPTIAVNSNKKYKIKKLCRNCGHYFHPCSLNRHIRQCVQTSTLKQ